MFLSPNTIKMVGEHPDCFDQQLYSFVCMCVCEGWIWESHEVWSISDNSQLCTHKGITVLGSNLDLVHTKYEFSPLNHFTDQRAPTLVSVIEYALPTVYWKYSNL